MATSAPTARARSTATSKASDRSVRPTWQLPAPTARARSTATSKASDRSVRPTWQLQHQRQEQDQPQRPRRRTGVSDPHGNFKDQRQDQHQGQALRTVVSIPHLQLQDQRQDQLQPQRQKRRTGVSDPHELDHFPAVCSTQSHLYPSGVCASPLRTGFCRRYSSFSSKLSCERRTWSKDSSCQTGPLEPSSLLTVRADVPFRCFRITGKEYGHPFSSRSGVNRRWT